MTTLVSIMAHGEAQSTFDRHLPYWNALGHDLMVFHPRNKPVLCPGIHHSSVGMGEHHGNDAIRRVKYIIRFLAGTSYDQHVIYEYDALSLEPLPVISANTLVANWWPEPEPGKGFSAHHYCHPPLMARTDTLIKLAQITDQLPVNSEGGMWDRWLGLAVEMAGIERGEMIGNIGYSMNTIHPAHFPHMINAINDGAVHLHGVKDKETLDLAVRTYVDKASNVGD